MPDRPPTNVSISDEALVAAIGGGDPNRFALLVDRYLERVRSFVALQTVSNERADAVVRDTFLHAFHHLDEWPRETPFPIWLQTFAAERLRGSLPTDDASSTILDKMDATIEPLPVSEDVRLRLEQCIAALPRMLRGYVRFRYGRGLSLEQVAATMNQEASWVGTVLFRIRQSIADILAGEGK